jgi:hypothetical protein
MEGPVGSTEMEGHIWGDMRSAVPNNLLELNKRSDTTKPAVDVMLTDSVGE